MSDNKLFNLIANFMIWCTTYGIFLLMLVGSLLTFPSPVSFIGIAFIVFAIYHGLRKDTS